MSNWTKAHLFLKDEKHQRRMLEKFAFIDDTALKLGVFEHPCFYNAFYKFYNQSIEKGLKSQDLNELPILNFYLRIRRNL